MKVATPAALVVAVVVPPTAPAPDPIVAEMTTPPCATGLPTASRSWRTGWGAKATPLFADAGNAVVNESLFAAPAATLNGVLVAGARPGEVTRKVYPVPTRLSVRLLKVAMPLIPSTMVVPPSVAFAGLPANAIVTGLVAPSTVLSRSSCSAIRIGGVSASPATLAPGCWAKTSRVAGRVETDAVAVPVFPSEIAEMVTGPPWLNPITIPVVVTAAIAGALDSQRNVRPLSGAPAASNAVAAS